MCNFGTSHNSLLKAIFQHNLDFLGEELRNWQKQNHTYNWENNVDILQE